MDSDADRSTGRGPRARPTLKAVAEDAAVSISTVSHVVNGTRFVDPETEARVRSSIGRLGYAPNRLARSLRRLSSDSIGLIVSDVGNPYYTDVIRGVEKECQRQGKTVLLAASDDDPAREESAIEVLRSHQVDGLILALASGTTERALASIVDSGTPVVLIDRLTELPVDQVGAENVEATATLVGHFLAMGHRQIGFISGVPGISTTEERISGYRSALASYGMAFDAGMVRSGNSRTEPARLATHDLLDENPTCTAIVSANNLMTIGVVKAATERGLKVPEDLAVVSFDDFEWTGVFEPRLTTMAQPSYEIGRQAIRLLLNRIEQPNAPTRTIRLAPTFMHRTSCGHDDNHL